MSVTWWTGACVRGRPGADPETSERLAGALPISTSGARYRVLAERAGRTPVTVRSWQEIPAVPAAAFAYVDFATDPPLETFRSIRSHSDRRSVHFHPFPDLYRAMVDATFPRFVLPRGGRPAMLALAPPRANVPDSASLMIAHVLGASADRAAAPATARARHTTAAALVRIEANAKEAGAHPLARFRDRERLEGSRVTCGTASGRSAVSDGRLRRQDARRLARQC